MLFSWSDVFLWFRESPFAMGIKDIGKTAFGTFFAGLTDTNLLNLLEMQN